MGSVIQNVLVVDDDPAILRVMRIWLERAGYLVTTADNGQAALSAIEAACPFYLITDWEMPVMDGLELCRRVRQLRLPHYIYTLLVTARDAPDDIIQGLEAGADDYLHKPINLGEMLARLRAGSRVLEMESRLAYLANSDALTGLYTKRSFSELLEREVARTQRYGLDLACVMLDIDFFKRINDTHGHPVGDEVIVTIARLLQASCRGSDIVARFGGEEFCVLLPETNEADALRWAERTRELIKSTSIPVAGEQLRVTCSFGVAEADRHAPIQALLDRADQCLLLAKQTGRDRVVRYQCIRQLSDLYGDPNSDYGALFRNVLARHVMTNVVVGLRQDATIGTAAEYFLRFRVGSAPVVDGERKLVGIVSEKDLMNVLLWPDCWTRPIRDVMRPNVVVYDEDTPALTIYEFLCRVSIRSVVIVKDGIPTGVINRGSLLNWFSNTLVQARGETTPAEFTPESTDPRARVRQAADALVTAATALRNSIYQDSPESATPYIIGGASRIQDLVTDILADSRFDSDRLAAAAMERELHSPDAGTAVCGVTAPPTAAHAAVPSAAAPDTSGTA